VKISKNVRNASAKIPWKHGKNLITNVQTALICIIRKIMIVSELIIALQKLPQDATVIRSGGDYPEEVSHVCKITKNRFDGYYTPGFHQNVNRDCVVKIG
jgi:hypothetical protein